jgi:hypothetical protein
VELQVLAASYRSFQQKQHQQGTHGTQKQDVMGQTCVFTASWVVTTTWGLLYIGFVSQFLPFCGDFPMGWVIYCSNKYSRLID